MELFKITPFTAAMLTFFVASCVFVYVGLPMKAAVIGFSAAVFVVLKVGRSRIFPARSDIFRKNLAYALIACILAGLVSTVFFDVRLHRFDDLAGTSDTVQVRIESCDYSLSYMARYHAVVTESGNIPKNTRILLTSEQTGLDDGILLTGELTYESLAESSSAGFDAERYYLPKRIFLTAEDVSLTVTGEDHAFRPAKFFRDLNETLTVRILAHTKREYGGTAAAVLLGNSEFLADSVNRDFRRLGISHLLVVSGTHFSVLLSFMNRFLIGLRLKRRQRALINLGLILFFMALTGFSGAVLRAGIMYLLAQITLLLHRKNNYLHSLALAGSLIVLWNPYAAADCGLQLSFAAAYSCLLYNELHLLFRRYLRQKRKPTAKPRQPHPKPALPIRLLRNISGVIGLTSLVNVTLLPLLWLYFGEVSLLSIPANLIFIPLVTLLMYLTGLYLVQYPLGLLTIPLGKCINVYCGLMQNLAETLSGLDHITLSVNYDFAVFFLIPLLIAVGLIPFISTENLKKLSAFILAILTVFFAVIGVLRYTDRPNVYFSYVTKGKNDGFVLKSNGNVLFCDVSDGSYGYLSELIYEMSERNACEVEVLLLTHYHNKHLQYLGRLCDREILRNLVLPEPIDDRERDLYNSLVSTAEREGVNVQTVGVGETFSFGEAEIYVHERKYLSRSTHPITAVSVTAYDYQTTLLSCSFNESHETLTNAAQTSDFVLFGHHSPVYKKAFGLSFDRKPKTLIVSDAAMASMTHEFADALTRENMLCEPADWCVRIGKNGNYTIVEQSPERSE